jgi:lysophospholipase L1-like esterase
MRKALLLGLGLAGGLLLWLAAYTAACLIVALGLWPGPPVLDRLWAAATSPATVVLVVFGGGALALRAFVNARAAKGSFLRAAGVAGIVALCLLVAAHHYVTDRLTIFDFRRGVPTLRPDEDLVIDRISSRRSIHVHTNEAGFRDRAWAPRPRAEGEYRVLLTGDSFTFGVGIADDRATLTPVLENELYARTGERYAVFNVALSGLDFQQEVDLVERFAADVDPDLVIVVHFEGNDLGPPLPHFINPGVVGWLLPAELIHLNAYDAWLREWQPLRDPAALAAFEAGEQRIARLASARGFDVLFAQVEGRCPPGWGRRVLLPSRVFAYSPIDLKHRQGDDTDGEGAVTLSDQDPHPNEEGIRRMARRMAKAVLMLRRERSGWIARGGVDGLTAEYERACGAEPRGASAP